MPITLSKCLQRQDHSVVDIEIRNSTTSLENENLASSPSAVVTIESSASTLNNAGDEVFPAPDFSDLSERMLGDVVSSVLFTLLAMTYTIFNFRRLAWDLEENDPKPTQQEKSSIYIGLIYQLCFLLHHASVFRMMWFKRKEFLSYFEFLDTSDISSNFNSMSYSDGRVSILNLAKYYLGTHLGHTAACFYCSNIYHLHNRRTKDWSFWGMLEYQEGVFLLGLKRSYETDVDSNHSSARSGQIEDPLINPDIFLSDATLETTLLGSTGMAMNFFQHFISMFSNDCFLLTTINLWIAGKYFREHFSQWENSRKRKGSETSYEVQNCIVVDEIVKKYQELSQLSRHLNAITDSILPALVFMNIITMSYFLNTCVLRDWNFAIFLALKFSKVCAAMFIATKTSRKAGKYYSWFISEDVQQCLGFDSKQMQRNVAEIKDSPLGNGTGAFYIDTRFLLSECNGNPGTEPKAKNLKSLGLRSRGKSRR
ncbi:unnamed protein product [Orchesella dallaii]|uniref:Gustatory receptor n=1 Tax=Orchesella dallaii TaxID=48710 RepID=A0ABP1QIR8_9HEXA